MELENPKDKNTIDWRKRQQITISAKDYFKKQNKNRRFKTTKENKP